MKRPALVLLALLVMVPVPAAAAATKGQNKGSQERGAAKIELLSPAEGKRVDRETLIVRLTVSTKAEFRATVAGNDVSRRFKRDGKQLVAKLKRGRDFGLGENSLLVATGNGQARRAKTLQFVARRAAAGLLGLTTTKTGNGRTPLRLKLRVGKPVERVRLTLNSHPIRLGSPAGKHVWVVALGADDGLRFGSNTIEAWAERTGAGRFDRERLRLRLDRSAPLVGAGPDRTTRSGRAVTLDGGSTRAAGRPGLLYRWKIVERPRRSRARIADSTAKVAKLLPDMPGTYRVRLTAAPASAAALAADRGPAASTSAGAGEPTCLQPAGSGSDATASASGFVPLDPLSAPACVTPFGDETTPPLPLDSRPAAAADEVLISALPTESPMGWPIETIAADGSIRVGPQTFPKQSGWARLLVLNQQSLLPESNRKGGKNPWESGDQVFLLSEAPQLAKAVEETTNRQIVVVTGMGQKQSPSKPAEEALAKLVSALGVGAPPSPERAAMVESGAWSVIGSRGESGRTFTNLYGLTQQAPAEYPGTTLPGTLNGYLQKVLVDAFSFVSPESVPIDTKAAGSSNTVSVFTVGSETVTSETIGNGSFGLHVAVFETSAPGGTPKLAVNSTFVIDDPYSNTDMNGVAAAAAALKTWRENPADLLIVMQSFGEGAVGPNTAPWASPSWVNDDLIGGSANGLYQWKGQPYLEVKHESELEEKLDGFWNPGYPTVAGQVGDLTGPVGHDVVANLGAGNPDVEVTRLTMVADNHPLNPTQNYVRGFAGPAEGRLVGVLVRDPEAGWNVQAGVSSPAFSPGDVWKIAYAKPTPWPLSGGAENEAAMTYIARSLFGASATDLREEYVRHREAPWSTKLSELKKLRYEATSAFNETTFEALQEQLETEMNDIVAIQKAIGQWQGFFGESSFAGFVRVSELGSKIADLAVEDSKDRAKKEAEVNPEAIISESLYTVAEVIGFPEAYEEIKLAEMVGIVAGGFGLAEAATPEEGEGEEGANTAAIRDRADQLGGALARHFESTSSQLGHLESIYLADWGKMKTAATEAGSTWALSQEGRQLLRQSLAVSTSQQLYEGLLPVAYDQWVISPYVTARNGNGPEPPGGSYSCPQFNPAYKSESYKRPFASEPAGALSTSVYRPFDAPGSSVLPARAYTTPFTIRALKSVNDKLKMRQVEYAENREGITVYHDGSSPPKTTMEPLFESVNPGEQNAEYPRSLGMSKVEFFADFGGGPPDFRRMICAQE
jgi:hypothetical protein